MCISLSAKVSYHFGNFSNHSNFTHIFVVWQGKYYNPINKTSQPITRLADTTITHYSSFL